MSRDKLNGINNANKEELFKVQTEEIAMGIEMSALNHIMNLLTTLYPEPSKATVREVVSNAIDSLDGVEGECAVKIYSPTRLAPQFIVEDTGIGMSLETIKYIYANYGASTKGLNLNQIGAYGLGAKAPLSYCTDFTVQSTHNEITTTVIVSRKNNGNFIEIVSSEHTGKPSGTKVIVPVKTDDIVKFNSAISTYEFMPLDNIDLYIDREKVTISDKYICIDENFVIYNQEETVTGKVWVKVKDIYRMLYSRNSCSHMFLLGGWIYEGHRPTSYYNPKMYFELKPGIVDFDSSRDGIVNNEKYETLHNLIMSKEGELKEKIIDSIKHLSFDNLLIVLNQDPSGTSFRIVKNDYDDSSSLYYKERHICDIKELKANETHDLNEIIKEDKIDMVTSICFYSRNLRMNMKINSFEHLQVSNLFPNRRTLPEETNTNLLSSHNFEITVAEFNKVIDNCFELNGFRNFAHYALLNACLERKTISIVCGLTADNVKKFKTNRKLIIDKINDMHIAFIANTEDELKSSSAYKMMKSMFTDVRVLDVNELIEYAQNLRQKVNSAKKVERVKLGVVPVPYRKCTFDGVGFFKEHKKFDKNENDVEALIITDNTHNHFGLFIAYAKMKNLPLEKVNVGIVVVDTELKKFTYESIQEFLDITYLDNSTMNPFRFKSTRILEERRITKDLDAYFDFPCENEKFRNAAAVMTYPHFFVSRSAYRFAPSTLSELYNFADQENLSSMKKIISYAYSDHVCHSKSGFSQYCPEKEFLSQSAQKKLTKDLCNEIDTLYSMFNNNYMTTADMFYVLESDSPEKFNAEMATWLKSRIIEQMKKVDDLIS